ncbi:hypothetical protein DID76_03160 [Candidatus Marinamargulisbacteria bacterium SCGC AG-414-C22]|nr:hypothetical protein DID76_03160 [Candidatus Marinamargulisbacteria bacterium SCGC AG-414-C22]
MSEFSTKKITQSNYRGSLKSTKKDDENFLNTQLAPIKVESDQKKDVKAMIVAEIEKVLVKLIPEEAILPFLSGTCVKSILKKLGI